MLAGYSVFKEPNSKRQPTSPTFYSGPAVPNAHYYVPIILSSAFGTYKQIQSLFFSPPRLAPQSAKHVRAKCAINIKSQLKAVNNYFSNFLFFYAPHLYHHKMLQINH